MYSLHIAWRVASNTSSRDFLCVSVGATPSVGSRQRTRNTCVVPFAHPTKMTGASCAYDTLDAGLESSVICNSHLGTTTDDAKSQISSVPASVTAANSVEHHGLYANALTGC